MPTRYKRISLMKIFDTKEHLDYQQFIKTRVKPRFYKEGVYCDRYTQSYWMEIKRGKKFYALSTTAYAFNEYMYMFEHIPYTQIEIKNIKTELYNLCDSNTDQDRQTYNRLKHLLNIDQNRKHHRYMLLTQTNPKLP